MRLFLVGAASARGLALTRSLVADDHAVRAVTRTEEHRAVLEEAGAEVWIGTPDRIGSLRYGLENGQPLSLRETGKVLGLSGERVRLIEREALRKLRDSNLINAVALGN